MFYLALALLWGQTVSGTENVDFKAQKCPVQVVDQGHAFMVNTHTNRPSHLPIPPIVYCSLLIDQEQGTGGDRGDTKPPVRPLKKTLGLALVDQEQGTGGDRGDTKPPVRPLKKTLGLAIVDQEQGTGGDRGDTKPPVKPLKKTLGLAFVDHKQGKGGDRGNTLPLIKRRPAQHWS